MLGFNLYKIQNKVNLCVRIQGSGYLLQEGDFSGACKILALVWYGYIVIYIF